MPPARLDRLLAGVYLDLVPVIVDAGADYPTAANTVLALIDELDDDKRARLSVDLGADPLTAPLSRRSALRSTTWSRSRHAWRTRAGCGLLPSTDPPSTTGRQRRLGARRQHRRRGQLSAGARRIRTGNSACPAADQFSSGRRRRPVHDDRENARGATTVGAGGRGGRRTRQRHGGCAR
ncbi:methylmalonyl-CoA mutase domain protein [Mycobacterium xenopi 4042]|uniref:Methylmalonyl-CoA mutase domain protein n=1 Tax=Mycobacterium xenopi 4042 TaxID=1299334 RepID=X7YNW2_MYCXE|nr:methylmalonyl-CoA mutase domain protein [Mycobacterium xenopi 4042]